MKFIIKSIIVLLLVGCAISATKKSDHIPPNPFLEQDKCINSWYALVREWEKNGVALSGSISKTQNLIVKDNSKLSVAFKNVWESQDIEFVKKYRNKWPVPHNIYVANAEKFQNEVIGKVADQCVYYGWLVPILMQEQELFSNESENELLLNSPFKSNDGLEFNKWIFFQLILRPEEFSQKIKQK